MKNRRLGLTLLELVVVVAVLGVPAATLAEPVYETAFETIVPKVVAAAA